jgi:hypothetical protein
MKVIVVFLALVLSAAAQTVANNSAEPRVLTLDMGAPRSVDPKLHADVVQLIELTGAREKLEAQKGAMVEEGSKKIVESCRECTPEFSKEWARRMLVRIRAEDFIDVYVKTYEKYFTQEDVTELIAIQKKTNAHEQVEPTPRLREKLQSVLPSLTGDLYGGCAKVGAELGGKVGQEIASEHPEYIKHSTTASQQ